MLSSNAKAYNELVGVLLSENDREKFEWVIGAMLDRGPSQILMISGPPGSGKTTLTSIVQKLLNVAMDNNFMPNVRFLRDLDFVRDPALDPYVNNNSFAFVEVLNFYDGDVGTINIETTGDRVPVNKHYVLVNQIDAERAIIADACVGVYRTLGGEYFNTYEENNR